MRGEYIVISPAGKIPVESMGQAQEYRRLYGWPYVKSYPEPTHNERFSRWPVRDR